jgi:hypothetical protein
MAAVTITEHEAEEVEEANATGKEHPEIEGAGHCLTIDHTGRKSCDTALEFVQRFV